MNIDFLVQNIKTRCRAMGITPTEACRESGVGRGFMDNVKKGSSPSIDRIEMLAKFFGCTIGELIGEEPPDKEKPIPGDGPKEDAHRLVDQIPLDKLEEAVRYLQFIKAISDTE